MGDKKENGRVAFPESVSIHLKAVNTACSDQTTFSQTAGPMSLLKEKGGGGGGGWNFRYFTEKV